MTLITHVSGDMHQRIADFYAFMTERENIRLRRLLGWPKEEWTYDPIFQKYSFTNVKREHDRTSTLLRQIYDEEFGEVMQEDYGPQWRQDPYHNAHNKLDALLLNCALYRYFGTIEAARTLGWSPEWNRQRREEVMSMGAGGELKFTAAYIVPNCGRVEPKYEIVCEVIDQMWKRSEQFVTQQTWQAQVETLRQCWCCGSFMAKEIVLDYVMATQMYPDDWQTWTPVGPGGCRGAGRILTGRLERISEELALDVIRIVYGIRDEYWRSDFVRLDLTDIQFMCCEWDKYSRVAEGRAPKRRFRPTVDAVTKAEDISDIVAAVVK